MEHINDVAVGASKLLGFVVRNCNHFSLEATRLVYCSLVRSILKYCSVVWSPYHQIHINSVERVQHKFLRHCAYKSHIAIVDHDYGFIENHLALMPLASCRDVCGAMFIFKLVHGDIDCPQLLSYIRFNVPHQGLRHHVTFNVPFHRTFYGIHSLIDHYMGFLNKHPNIDIFNATISQVKRSLALQ